MLKQIALGMVLLAGLLVGTAWADESLNQQLISAVEAGDIAKVGALIAKGAEVNAHDKEGDTPLHVASVYRNKDAVEMLIAKGADVNATNTNDGATPLHYAAFSGYKDMAELLISRGANVNAKENMGRTPLALAEHMKHNDVAELLIAHGAHQ